MSRFEKIFRSKKSKNGFLGLKSLKKFLGLKKKRFFKAKKDFLGLKRISKSIFLSKDKKIWGGRKIFGGVKKAVKKNWGNMAKKGDFGRILEIYGLEQLFFRSKKSKKQVFRSNFLFFRSKKSKK